MDVEELRNEAVALMGWTWHPDANHSHGGVFRHTDGHRQTTQPLELTLDAVAGAMPKGWHVTIEQCEASNGDPWWDVSAMNMKSTNADNIRGAAASTELHARLALLVAVLKADRKDPP